ncbi:hypothetical protein, partial [Rhodoligotrophos defluvii]|uniref:hypothetical protein n=1 Tax=Rhodoligotrophos defluvii TaxID=2561934 RepID=UPI00195F872C
KAHAYDAYAKTARDFRILDALRVCIGLDLVTIGICFLCAPFMLCIRYSRQNTRWFIESQANTIKKIWKICLGIIAFSLICLLLPIHVLIVGNHISFKPRIGGSGEWGNYPLFLDPFCITKDSYFMLIFSVSFILFLLCMKGAYIRYIIMHKSKQRQIFISS